MKFHEEFSPEEFKIVSLELVYELTEMLDKKEIDGDSFFSKIIASRDLIICPKCDRFWIQRKNSHEFLSYIKESG